ncbi:SMP-30/gluconolactonase/LRE family protein [Streptomyces sp. CC208A]|uniref:SMP-30/gluconolactonase/LRE family protein n=1 Tax=Streptomyces sp. CC208A TaxID=3044573 RepID=UPI0024A9140D|nr:SMP-30/gluconolactonase/LRE family protein [Streptomyces sp. CC208A]
MHRVPRIPHVPRLAAVATAALTLLAAGPASAGDPTVTDPRILAHFSAASGQNAESIALEPDGSADITFAFARQVARVDKQGVTEILATLPDVPDAQTPVGGAVVTGIARAHDGTLYVNYITGTEETGVWRVDPGTGETTQIGFLPENAFPNGLALDEKCGTLYVADSLLGTVWSLPVSGGTPTAWATGAALEPTAQIPFGANGLQVHDGAVWVSNSGQGTLLRIPVGPGPDYAAGPVETRATGLPFIDDFAFTGHGDTVLAARIEADEVELVRSDGTHKTVLTEEDGLDNPTSVAVRGKQVYVNSAAFFNMTDPDPNLLLARLSEDKVQGKG